MKKVALFIAFLVTFTTGISAQVPSDWDTNKPRDTAEQKYIVGISQPVATEQEAYKNAWQNAVQQFAETIAVRYEGRSDITVQSQNYASENEDAFIVTVETSSFSSNTPLAGVRELARKMTRQDGKYVAFILATMSTSDWNKAKQYVENEEAAYLAYQFFGQKGLFAFKKNEKPAGFQDYYSWLRNNCIIISIDDPNPNALLEQLDQFIKKLYKNATVFAQVVNGRGVRIVYNSGKYYDGLLRSLQTTALFTIQREDAGLVLKPAKANILADFRTAVGALKDSGKFVITGRELIQTQNGEMPNSGTIVINQFKTIASRQFNMQAVAFAIPAQFLSGSVDEDGIIRHIKNNSGAFPARYLIICNSETKLSNAIPEYKIPNLVNASCSFALYDLVTGETLHSETAETASGAFTPSNLEDRTVISESRKALEFLYNAKTKPNLENIMKDVLGEL